MWKCFSDEASVLWQGGSITACAADSQGGSLWRGSSRTAAGLSCLPSLCWCSGDTQVGVGAGGHVWGAHSPLVPLCGTGAGQWLSPSVLSVAAACAELRVMNLTLLPVLTLSESTNSISHCSPA